MHYTIRYDRDTRDYGVYDQTTGEYAGSRETYREAMELKAELERK